MTKVDEIVKTYKTLSQIPSVVEAQFISQNVINTVYSQRNLETGTTAKFSKLLFLINGRVEEVLPIDVSAEILSVISKTRKYRAVIRENEKKQFLEIWKNNNLFRCVDLGVLDVHGIVYADEDFASFEFSPDEKKLLYVAEKKPPKTEPFYKRKKPEEGDKADNGDTSKPTKGDEYVFTQDWGEQMAGKKCTILAEYHIETDTVEILKGIPDHVCVGQPKYAPDGNYIIGVAYFLEPRKLGIKFCGRPSTIFKLDFVENYLQLPLKNRAVQAPIFTTDGCSVLWLDRDAHGPHSTNMKLVLAKTPLSKETKIKTIVDTVPSKIKIKHNTNFFGLYNKQFIRNNCWASNKRLLVNTQQKYTINSYIINIDDGTITELKTSPHSDCSQLILGCQDDTVLALRRNFLVPDQIFMGKLPSVGSEDQMEWLKLCSAEPVPEIQDCTFQYLDLQAKEENCVRDFNAIYIGPKTGHANETPLMVCPHGGPHSAFANYMVLEYSLLLSLGYAILLVNYRGSLGSGEDSVNFLPGKVCTVDVQDCIQATNEALKEFTWLDPDALVLSGGSHGGFVVTHLSGQYPDKFKAVVTRNPVIDIASKSIQSDIPDASYVEVGELNYTQKGEIDNGLLLKMREMSPIVHAHKVKAPTLFLIGSKDLRVPPCQGIEYHLRLKANGVPTKMHLYDDNHSISSVSNEFDKCINSILWFEEHLGRS